MLAFSRITSVLFFVLSLSFFAYAAPTPAYNSNEVAPSYEKGQKALALTGELNVQLEAEIEVLTKVDTLAQVAAQVDVIVGHVNACANAVVALGGNVQVNDDLKGQIVVKVVACITLIVQACIALIAKFGALAVLTILVKLDICLQALLVALRACIDGILLVIVAHLKLNVAAFAEAHLGLCLNLLGLIRL